jgi:hypothetical protein
VGGVGARSASKDLWATLRRCTSKTVVHRSGTFHRPFGAGPPRGEGAEGRGERPERGRSGLAVPPSLEEALDRFCGYVGLGEPAVRQDEWLTAQLRALALCPEPAFTVPAALRRAPRGWFAIAGEPPMLYAALAGELAAMGLL